MRSLLIPGGVLKLLFRGSTGRSSCSDTHWDTCQLIQSILKRKWGDYKKSLKKPWESLCHAIYNSVKNHLPLQNAKEESTGMFDARTVP